MARPPRDAALVKLQFHLVLLVATAVACASRSSPVRGPDHLQASDSMPSAGPDGIRAVVNGLTSIGPRETGSDACRRAETWLASFWQRLGFSNVQLEDYTLEHSWSPGPVLVEELGPEPRRIQALSLDRTGSTKGSVEGKVIELPLDLEVMGAQSSLRGAVVLLSPIKARSFGDLHLGLCSAAAYLEGRGAIALLLGFPQPGLGPKVLPFACNEGVYTFPVLLLGNPDYQPLRREVQTGAARLRISVQTHWGPPVAAHNVVAEIPGRELPKEVLLVHAHLDSVYVSPGALDDAVGVAMLTEALRSFRDSRSALKRTVRIVAFSGEEQGRFGSRAYVARHRGEMSSIRMVMAVDRGTGPLTGFTTLKRSELLPVLSASLGQAARKFQLSSKDSAVHSDNVFFVLEGVPALEPTIELGDYFIHHHRPTDTLERVSLDVAAQNAALLAEAIAQLANSDIVLGQRLDKTAIQTWLSDQEDRDELQLLRVSYQELHR